MTLQAVIIGVGNQFRHDDFAGIEVVRRLQGRAKEVSCLEQSGEGVKLMETWKGLERVILVDAVSSSVAPGTLHCIDANKEALPKNWFSCSTHNFGVAEAVEMASVMGTLPESLKIYGIEGKCFSPGEGLSPEVDHAVNQVVDEIINTIVQEE